MIINVKLQTFKTFPSQKKSIIEKMYKFQISTPTMLLGMKFIAVYTSLFTA